MSEAVPITIQGDRTTEHEDFTHDMIRGAHSQASERAQLAVNQAIKFADQLQELSTTLADIPNADHGTMKDLPEMQVFKQIVPPTAPDIEPAYPNLPVAPDMDKVTPINPDAPPEFTEKLPVISKITAPEPLSVDGPGSAPTLTTLSEVSVPDVSPPDAPEFEDMNVPDVPALNLEPFEQAFPTIDLAVRDFQFGMDGLSVPDRDLPSFNFTGIQTLHNQTSLACQSIFNGDRTTLFRLFPNINDAALQRARDRQSANDRFEEATILNGFASRGFSRPPGAASAALRRAREAKQARDATTIQEMMIQESKDERDDFRWASDIVLQTTEKMLGFETMLFERSVSFQKNVLESGIAFFNHQKDRILLQITQHEARRTDAKERILMALSSLEETKVQLDAAKTRGSLNDLILKRYVGEIQAVESVYGLYLKELEGEKLKLSFDQNKLDGFAKEIAAFDSQVQAKGMEYDAYSKKWQGEGVKIDLFAKSAEAYKARVSAYGTKVGALGVLQDGEVKRQALKIDLHRANLEAFTAATTSESERIKSMVGLFEGKAKIFTSQVGAEEARSRTETEQFKAISGSNESTAKVNLEQAKINMGKAQTSLKVLMDASTHLSGVFSQLAAASMSVVNLSGSVSDSLTTQTARSTSYSRSIHGDSYHGDTIRGNTTTGDTHHGDSHHGDTRRGDTHVGDSHHGNSTHGDTRRGDTHVGDSHHGDSHHGDTRRGDTHVGDSHHGDSHHGNSTHGDSRRGDTHVGDSHHGDSTHGNSTHGDTTRGNTTSGNTTTGIHYGGGSFRTVHNTYYDMGT